MHLTQSSQSIEGNGRCDNHPDRPAMHVTIVNGRESNHCCECHIAAGGIPADWHPDCIRAYAERTKDEEHDQTPE